MSSEAQHYIPQFYLKHFSKKVRKSYRIACFDKQSRRQYSTNIKNVAQETNFYEYPSSEVPATPFAEDYFQEKESIWAEALSELVTDPRSILSCDIRSKIFEFIASFLARTTEYRKIIQSITNVAQDHFPESTFPDLPENHIREMQSKSINTNIPVYSSILEKMKFFIFKNMSGNPIWTSDQPVIKYNEDKDPHRGNLGLLSKGIQLYFPLSPAYVLGLSDPDLLATTKWLFHINEPHVEFCNSGQVVYSVSYIYSRIEEFELARSMLRENPIYGDLNRPRVI